jgi:hypothetical protein
MPTRKQKAIKLLLQDHFMFGFITSWFPAGLWTWQCHIISKYLRKIWQISSLATVPTDNQSFHWPAIKNHPLKEILKLWIHCVYVPQNFPQENISCNVDWSNTNIKPVPEIPNIRPSYDQNKYNILLTYFLKLWGISEEIRVASAVLAFVAILSVSCPNVWCVSPPEPKRCRGSCMVSYVFQEIFFIFSWIFLKTWKLHKSEALYSTFQHLTVFLYRLSPLVQILPVVDKVRKTTRCFL